MPRASIEEFGDASARDGRGKPLIFDVIYRLVTLARIDPSVRKRYERAHGAEGSDDQFVAIKRIAQLARDVGPDAVDSHDAPPRRYATCARPRSSDQADQGRCNLGPDVDPCDLARNR